MSVSEKFRKSFLTKLKQNVALLDDVNPYLGKSTPAKLLMTKTGQPIPYPLANREKSALVGAFNGEAFAEVGSELSATTLIIGAWKHTSKIIRISNELLADKAFDVEDWLSTMAAQRFGAGFNEVLVQGLNDECGNRRISGLLYLTGTKPLFYNPSETSLQKRLVFCDKPFLANTNTLLQLGLQTNPKAIVMDTVPDGALITGQLEHFIIRVVTEMGMHRMTERYAEFGETAFVMTMRWSATYVGEEGGIQVWYETQRSRPKEIGASTN